MLFSIANEYDHRYKEATGSIVHEGAIFHLQIWIGNEEIFFEATATKTATCLAIVYDLLDEFHDLFIKYSYNWFVILQGKWRGLTVFSFSIVSKHGWFFLIEMEWGKLARVIMLYGKVKICFVQIFLDRKSQGVPAVKWETSILSLLPQPKFGDESTTLAYCFRGIR